MKQPDVTQYKSGASLLIVVVCAIAFAASACSVTANAQPPHTSKASHHHTHNATITASPRSIPAIGYQLAPPPRSVGPHLDRAQAIRAARGRGIYGHGATIPGPPTAALGVATQLFSPHKPHRLVWEVTFPAVPARAYGPRGPYHFAPEDLTIFIDARTGQRLVSYQGPGQSDRSKWSRVPRRRLSPVRPDESASQMPRAQTVGAHHITVAVPMSWKAQVERGSACAATRSRTIVHVLRMRGPWASCAVSAGSSWPALNSVTIYTGTPSPEAVTGAPAGQVHGMNYYLNQARQTGPGVAMTLAVPSAHVTFLLGSVSRDRAVNILKTIQYKSPGKPSN